MKNYTQTSESSQDSGVLSNPLASLHSGDYLYSGATLSNRGYSGFLWSLRSESTTNTNGLNFYESSLNLWYGSNRGNGFVVRCKSFTTLINTSYSMKTSNSEHYDAGTLSNPLSYVRSGTFVWLNADLSNRGGRGYFWSLRSISTLSSNYLTLADSSMSSLNGYERGVGFAVRCLNPSPLSLILAIL